MSYFPLSFPNVVGIPDWLSLIAVSPLSETLALYLRDGAYVTDPVIADSLATYTPGVSERRGGTTRYTHSGLKNTGAQSTNAIVATRVYDAYGMVRSTTGTWSGPFGYAGDYGYQEDETGLRLLGHRYYDASTGRFLTRDPIKDGRNWYSYCDGDPMNGVDPTGLYRILLEPVEVKGRLGIHWNIIIEEDNGDWVRFAGAQRLPWWSPYNRNTSDPVRGTGGYKGRKGTRAIVNKKGKSGKSLVKKATAFSKEWKRLDLMYDEGCTSNTYAALLLEFLGVVVAEPTPPPGVPTTVGGTVGWGGRRRVNLGGNKPDGSPTFVYPPMYK